MPIENVLPWTLHNCKKRKVNAKNKSFERWWGQIQMPQCSQIYVRGQVCIIFLESATTTALSLAFAKFLVTIDYVKE